ncbi:recombinase family protein [Leifsonia sp. NPDC058248]|uniref:recombinase family protein n=1 Tax=Leifsonia sp. NPDC058248 TaxID=3346402 RepID=UPI0036DE0DCE
MPKRAVLYLRLSNASDTSTSIARQEADLRALAEREGWDVTATLTDEGISGRKSRANAVEALRMIADGEADVLVVWKFDRWSRQGLSAVAQLIGTLDARPDTLFVAMADGLRSDQPTWRIIAAILSEVARIEAENTSLRVRSSMHALKHSGRFSGGNVPYGYRPAPNPHGEGRILLVDPAEAATIREIAERLLDGNDTIPRIILDLHARAVPAPRSAYRKAVQAGRDPDGLATGRWQLTSIMGMLTGDAILGRMKHQGELVLGDDGLPAQVWEPIVDLHTVQRLRARVNDPRGASSRKRKPYMARLLSGLVYCKLCGTKMYVNTGRNGGPGYRCAGPVNGIDCRGPAISAQGLEDHISDAFLKMIGDAPEFREIEEAVDSRSTAELAEVETALSDVTTAMLADDSDIAALTVRLSKLKNRRSQLRALPTTVRTSQVATGRTFREAWSEEEDLGERRRFIAARIDHIEVGMRETRGPRFDPSRLTIHWRDWTDAQSPASDERREAIV